MTCAYDTPGRPVDGYAEPEPQEHWRGPNGHTLLSWEVDFGDGGGSRLRMRSPEGKGYCIEGVRPEIVEPERIVFTGALELEDERLTEVPGTVTFRRTERAE